MEKEFQKTERDFQEERLKALSDTKIMKNSIFPLLALLLFASCSTTRNLVGEEVLYVGVKKMEIMTPENFKLDSRLKSVITSPLSYPPNNPLISPYCRTPFPIGLWVYNWNIKKKKGVKWWLYRQLAKEPVLLSDVRPELRLKMVENHLKDYGFFRIKQTYDVLPRKCNSRKAKISYRVELSEPFRLNTVSLWGWPPEVDSILQRAMPNSLLKPGNPYNVEEMERESRRMADLLRNMGYYYFQPDYIEFLADTARQGVDLRIGIKQGVSDVAFRPYRIKSVGISLSGSTGEGKRDTVVRDGVTLDYTPPEALKNRLLLGAVQFRPGQLYSAWRQDRTQVNLVQLGVFKYANLMITPADSVTSGELDLKIDAVYALPVETEAEVAISSKSNNLLGPGLTLSLGNRNLFKRAETFSLKLTGGYEWQLGGTRNMKDKGLINSYEFGLNLNLAVPRLVPGFVKSTAGRQESTHFQIGTDFLNRHSYFRMVSFWGNATYDFFSSRKSNHSLVPFKLTYTRLLRTSHEFDSTLNHHPAIALSFRNQFIPSMTYAYTFDGSVSDRNPNRFYWRTSLVQAGNIISGIERFVAGRRGSGKKIFGNVYSQFLKLTGEVIRYERVSENSLVAMRFMGGVGYAYGNIRVMPYSEQFYIGGANGLRAFRIRSIGPGSYHPRTESVTAYLDQTGDVKLETDIGYRFKIAGRMYGALFVDAGNVWLLRREKERPGGAFRLKGLWREIALGTGAGLRYDITYIVIRADLGVALHAPYDTGKSGYFNIRNYGFKDGLVLNLAIGYPF